MQVGFVCVDVVPTALLQITRNIVDNMKRIIGITGGIGTGKTTVSNYIADVYKLPVLDADILAREAVQPGSSVLNQITERYTDILLPDGMLNRAKLGEIIFNNSEERQWLEGLIHPYVGDRLSTAIHQLPPEKTLISVIPLLFEAQMTDLVTEIWVVRCSEQQQIERIMQRNSLSLDQAKSRIYAQMSLEEKCKKADIVLDNSSTLENLLKQIDRALAE